MKITKIKIIPIRVPYIAPVSISLGTISEARNVVVRIHTSKKIEGLGEVSPFIYGYSKETQQSAVSFLKKISPRLIGKNPLEVGKIHHMMDELSSVNWCARSGIDVALYDLMGKALNMPVCRLFGRKPRKRIPVLFALNERQKSEDMAREAEKKVRQGFRGIMIKLGRGVKQDTKTAKMVRERIGEKISVIADPNQAYSTEEAVQLTKKIYRYIQALEGPVKGDNIIGLKKIKDLNLTTVIADESLFSPKDAVTLVKRQAADMFLIKLLKVGGFYQANQILKIARMARIQCYAASMTNLGIGHAANLHFAASSLLEDRFGFGLENLFQIFGSQEKIDERDIATTPKFKKGFFEIPQGPGLGIKPKEKNIKKYTIKEIVYP